MPDISTFLFLISNGLIWGFIIALIALGLALIFGVMGIVNMAHGDIYMIGAVLTFFLINLLGNFWLSLLLVIVIIILIAAPMEAILLRPYEGDYALTFIATIGLSFILEQLVLWGFGGMPQKIPNPWPVSINIFGVNYPGYRILVACIAIFILIGLWLFLYKTPYGIQVRATMEDREMASAVGIDVNKVLITTFVLGSILAAVAGVLAAPINQVSYLMGHDVMLLCFMVVIIGGMGSLEGAVVVALSLGLLEGGLVSFLTPVQARAVLFVVMILFLTWRPMGLFGKEVS